jgi:hypothetical protein
LASSEVQSEDASRTTPLQPRHRPLIQCSMRSTSTFMGHCDALGQVTLFSHQFFRLSLFAFFIALVSGPQPGVVQAQADDWTNAGTGSWFTAGNWSLDTVPTAAINAAVDDGGTAPVVGQSATVGNLTIGATTPGSTMEVTSGTILTINALTIGPRELFRWRDCSKFRSDHYERTGYRACNR